MAKNTANKRREEQQIPTPLIFSERFNLLGTVVVTAESINRGTISLESDKYVCTCLSDELVIVDLTAGNAVKRVSTVAEAAIVNPVSKIVAVREPKMSYQNPIQIFSLENNRRMNSYMSPLVAFWRWISPQTIALINGSSVSHWSVEKDAEPHMLFELDPALQGFVVKDYRVSEDSKWCLVVGVRVTFSATTGVMQLYSVDQRVSQTIKGRAGTFANINIRGRAEKVQVLLHEGREVGFVDKLYTMELGKKNYAGEAFDLPPMHIDTALDLSNDYPVAMQASPKHDILYMFTKKGQLTVFDIHTGEALCRTVLATGVLLTTIHEATGGVVVVAKSGAVIQIALNEKTLIPYVRSTRVEEDTIAMELAARLDLPGADDLYPGEFKRLLASGDVVGAAKLAAGSPNGLLRTAATIQSFKEAPMVPGTTGPFFLYFSELLAHGKLNGLETMEITSVALSQGQTKAVENWLKQDKLECSEELGELVLKADTNLALLANKGGLQNPKAASSEVHSLRTGKINPHVSPIAARVDAGSHRKDRIALLALFRATGGPTLWLQKVGWGTRKDLGSWQGVSLNAQGRVNALWLSSNNLEGRIPSELGMLSALEGLHLEFNSLSGSIPPELGRLGALKGLHLDGNKLSGSIPAELGMLGALEELRLDVNSLSGAIPPELGGLGALKGLHLDGNKLSGCIPPELGMLTVLLVLHLDANTLSGAIPRELGGMVALKGLHLDDNQLSGTIPGELAMLGALTELYLSSNKLSGAVPAALGNLRRLESLGLDGNSLDGGPLGGESLNRWRSRLLQGRTSTGHKAPRIGASDPPMVVPEVINKPTEDIETPNAMPEGTTKESVRAPVEPSSPALAELTQEINTTLEELENDLLEVDLSPGTAFSDRLTRKEDLKELETLLGMTKTLQHVASSKAEDLNMQQKELALEPSSVQGAYYNTVRSGICNAYLAASVVGSNMVATSKTGAMGTAGKALNLLASAAPMIVGLTSLAAALQAGDHFVQTKKVVKITEIAADVVECCALARRVAMTLAESLKDETCHKAHSSQEELHPAGLGASLGRQGQAFDSSQVDADGEAMMDWFVDEVAAFAPGSESKHRSPLVKEGERCGKKHLKLILKALGKGCVYGVRNTDAKIHVLLRVILTETEFNSVSTSNVGRQPLSGIESPSPPVTSTFHVASSVTDPVRAGIHTDLAAVVATVEDLKATLKTSMEDNQRLTSKLNKLESRATKSEGERAAWVDAGGDQVYQQVAVTATVAEFFERAESRATSGDHNPLTRHEFMLWLSEKSDLEAEVQDEVDARLTTLEISHGKKNRKGR